MSDFAVIAIMLAVFIAGATCVGVLSRPLYKRCDDILTGSVNGSPVSTKSRWLFLFHDYLALSFGITMILGVVGVGFVVASQIVGDGARIVAYSCAVVSGGFSVFNLMLGINWMVHFASVLRQAEAD